MSYFDDFIDSNPWTWSESYRLPPSVHFLQPDGRITCGQSKPSTTTDRNKVTCYRCIKLSTVHLRRNKRSYCACEKYLGVASLPSVNITDNPSLSTCPNCIGRYRKLQMTGSPTHTRTETTS